MASEAIKVETNVPMPTVIPGRNSKARYPWREMEVGQSFVFPDDVSYDAAYQGAYYANYKLKPKKFRVARHEGVIRCWRLA